MTGHKRQARQLLPWNADRAEWEQRRKRLIGSSDIPSIVNASGAFGDPYMVWAEKTGRYEKPKTKVMQRGTDFEDTILRVWLRDHAEPHTRNTRTGLWQSLLWEWAGATPDRLCRCPLGRGVVEAKKRHGSAFEWGTDRFPNVPTIYQYQGQWQLFVLGERFTHVHFAVDIGYDVISRLMFRDDDMQQGLLERAVAFVDDHLIPDIAPEATEKAADILPHMWPTGLAKQITLTEEQVELLRAAKQAAAAEAEAKKWAKQLLTQLKAQVGDATQLLWPQVGTVAASWEWGSTVDGLTEDWQKTHPDLVERYGRPETRMVVDVAKLLEEHDLADVGLRLRRTWTFDPKPKKGPKS